MRKYFDENDANVIKAREIAEKQFELQNEDSLDYDTAVYFMQFDVSVVNPFMDDTGRFDFTLDQAYEYYGSNVMNWFIDFCNRKEN